MPVTPDIQVAGIRRTEVQGQPTRKVIETPSRSITGHGGIPTLWEVIGRRIVV
jgi:hypothetical protein